ncbi:MAG: amidohydrolase family protein [Bacteroidetes bacterium]|nr:amidohydrolase family protein [Bacteroidota bacterium]MDA1118985.1 amidohydrolase family protein [Bacteroidota bacterium]
MVIAADLLWDGINDKPLSNWGMEIVGERIRNVTPIDQLDTSVEEMVILRDCTIMPGLIDSHTHLSMDASLENYLDHMSDPLEELTARAIAMMKKDLDAGITTCRCLGDREFLDVACKEAIESGLVQGPNILIATRGIKSPTGHGFVGYPFEGADEIVRAIRENARAGADLIKIYISGTLKGSGNLPSFLRREEIRIAIETAHECGLPVASHCVGGEGLDWALELGLDTLEHAYHITAEQIEKLSNSNTKLVLTPGPMLSDQRIQHLPKNLIPGHCEEKDEIYNNMASMIAAKIPFALGTDGMHGSLHEEIQYAVDMGASHVEALKAATIHGAKVCGIEENTGSLETSKYADLIIVKGNPFQEVSALKNIEMVMKRGDVVVRLDNKET